MIDLKSLNIVRLDDHDGKVRFAVTTTELDRREDDESGKLRIYTFEQVSEESPATPESPLVSALRRIRLEANFSEETSATQLGENLIEIEAIACRALEGRGLVPPVLLPEVAHDASDVEHLIHASKRLCELRFLGVDAMSPGDPAIAPGKDKLAAVEEAKKLVTNHIAFYRKRIEEEHAPKPEPKKRAKAAKVVTAPETPEIPPAPPESAESIAKREAEKKAKVDDAKAKQARLAAQVATAQQAGFNW